MSTNKESIVEENNIKIDLKLFPTKTSIIFKNIYADRNDVIEDLIKVNSKWMDKKFACWYPKHYATSVLDKRVIFTINTICEHFKLTAEVKALTIELFNRLYLTLLKLLDDYVDKKPKEEENMYRDRVESCIIKQVPLRLLSCVLLSSKIIDRDQVLPASEIYKFLSSDRNKKVNLKHCKQSECRVVKVLDFELHSPTTYTTIETLLAIRESDLLKEWANQAYAVALQLLDMFYIERKQLYVELFIRKNINSIMIRFMTELDVVISGAAIVMASYYLINQDFYQIIKQEYIKDFRNIVNVDLINEFSQVMIKFFLRDYEKYIKLMRG